MYAHYHRETDVAWFLFTGEPGDARLVSEKTDWGLIDRDSETGQVAGIELWGASSRLPAVFLEALPEPSAEEIVIERQSA
ncbi:MAG: hypothetical protein QOG26_1580 [Solirubrobacterales bacterium]|jgi:uncharacterized protein YuzE|nr:hypothetical protein [Solirubrobacterales bacterium]MDX6652007.1 hypothetical protein [Solirubrobacterales bacterium]